MKFFNTLAGYLTGVLAVWAAIFVVGYFLHGSTPGHPLLHVFGGFLLGMLSMYIATRILSVNLGWPFLPMCRISN